MNKTQTQQVAQPRTGKELTKHYDGYPLLGQCVFFSTSEFLISIEEVRERLKKAGLKPDFVKDILLKNALKKAMKKQARGVKNAFHRTVSEESDRTIITVAKPDVSNSRAEDIRNVEVAYSTDLTASYEKGSKKIQVAGEGAQEVKKDTEIFSGNYDADKFRAMVLRILDKECKSISVRPTGGIYFVASSKQEELDKLQKLFDLFPEASLDYLPIIDTKEAKRSMWKSIVGDVKQELKAAQSDLGKLPSEISSKKLEGQLRRYKNIRVKVEMYETVFSNTAEDLKNELDALSKLIQKKVLSSKND